MTTTHISDRPETRIAVIGKPEAGKTVFLGQLYNRLNAGIGCARLGFPLPANLQLLNAIREDLNDGKVPAQTPYDVANEAIQLTYCIDGKTSILSYPDISGEYFRSLATGGFLNEDQQLVLDRCHRSMVWILFVPIEDFNIVPDVVNRFQAYYTAQDGHQESGIDENQLLKQMYRSQSFYISLLQKLWFHQNWDLASPRNEHRLLVVASKWDQKTAQYVTPVDLFKANLPLLYDHLCTSWPAKNIMFLGLSSLGEHGNILVRDRPLDGYNPLMEGYWILEDGTQVEDLTAILQYI